MMLSEALAKDENGMITFVGAGGKSSLLRRLGMEWSLQGRPFLVTTTTKMFYEQVTEFAPVCCDEYDRGLSSVEKNLSCRGYAGWFSNHDGDKVLGLPLEWIERFSQMGLVSNVLIEGDGAAQKLIKAPNQNEPVVSALNKIVVGVLNLGAVGKNLDPAVVHRLDLVTELLDKKQGDRIEPQDIAILACHQKGVFYNTYGDRILVLTNVESCNLKVAEEIIEKIMQIEKKGIRRFVVTKGFDKQIEPVLLII